MKKLITILILCICKLGYSQCADYEKLDLGGTYLSRTHNYISFDIKYNDSIYLENISYPQDIKKIETHSNFILSKAKAYIINRGGESFYKNLVFESLEVNYPKAIEVDYDNPELYKLENYDVSYWILYTYKKDTYKYAFGLLFNKIGEMISENKFPDVSKNPNFESYINPCDALKLVKSDKAFQDKKIDFIELTYVDDINSFCWLIKEEKHPVKLGSFHLDLLLYFVSANSNKIEKIETEKVSGIACGIEMKPVKKKKKSKK